MPELGGLWGERWSRSRGGLGSHCAVLGKDERGTEKHPALVPRVGVAALKREPGARAEHLSKKPGLKGRHQAQKTDGPMCKRKEVNILEKRKVTLASMFPTIRQGLEMMR